MTFLTGLIVPLLAILFESYPRFINRTFGVDIWTHLLYLKEFHKQKGIPKKISDGFLVSGEYDYPPLFILIMSKFPLSVVKKYEFLFSPFWDAVHIFLIYLFSFWITQDMLFSIFVQGIYLLTPIIVIENSSATPRSLGYTLFSILFVSLFYFIQYETSFILLALITGPLILLSHRFTTQGFLFFSVFFSIIYTNPVFVLIFIWSTGVAIVLSRGFYRKVLRGHLGNLRFWRKVIRFRYAHQVRGNVSEKSSSDVITALYQQFLKFPPFVLSITNPWLVVCLGNIFLQPRFSSLDTFFVYWIVFSYVLALGTTAIERLRFLGEGQRYLELSAFPTAYLAAKFYFLASSIPVTVLFGLIACGAMLTIVVIQRKAIIKDTLRTLTPELIKMFNYLRNLSTKPNILCIPHQITTSTIYHTGCNVFVNADYTNIEKIAEVYPYLQMPLPQIMKKYHLDAILLNERYAKIDELKLGKYKETKKIGSMVLLQINK